MTEQPPRTWPTPYHIAGEAFGIRVFISTNSPELMTEVEDMLPPGWVPQEPPEAIADADREVPHFVYGTDDGIEYLVTRNAAVLARSSHSIALHVLDAQMRAYISLYSPAGVFVHAGVVAYHGRAIVIPGKSFSGKTTLVSELVRAGATYYSDEYAVLDDQGLVHPYAKPLSIRTNGSLGIGHHASTLGGEVGTDRAPLGLIVVAQYRPGATWQPRTLSAGEAVLALLEHTVPAQERPEETMNALRKAVDGSGAVALMGERGDASEIVQQILAGVSE